MLEYRLMKIPCCDVCSTAFNEATNSPRILKICGHTICEQCIQTLITRAETAQITLIECPLCKLKFSLQKYSITEFPKNFAILESIMVVNEENPCHHGNATPQEFICLESHCVNNGKFCGLCYYTVHAKCNRKLVLKIKDYESKVKIEPFLMQPAQFLEESLERIAAWSSDSEKDAAGKLVQALFTFLTNKCTNPPIPELSELIDHRKRYYIHLEPESETILLQPRQRQLVNDFELEFRKLMADGSARNVTQYDLLRSLKYLYLLLDESQEAKTLCELLTEHEDVMQNANFEFVQSTLEKSQFLTQSFEDFKSQFEACGEYASIAHKSASKSALLKKVENDLAFVTREINSLNSNLQKAKTDRRKKHRDGIIELQEIVFFKLSEIRQILELFGWELRAEAEQLLDGYKKWSVSAKEAELIRNTLKDEDLAKLLETHEEKYLVSKECSLHFTEEDKQKFISAAEDSNDFATKIAELVPLYSRFGGNRSLGWKGALNILAAKNPKIESEIDPIFTYERSSLGEFFSRTGLLSKHAENKVVYTAFYNQKKLSEFASENFTEYLSLVANQSELLENTSKELKRVEALSDSLKNDQEELQYQIQDSLEVEMLLSKVFKNKLNGV